MTNTLNIGDSIVVDEHNMPVSNLNSKFANDWKELMDNNNNEWTILEMEDGDLARATNRFTTRATRRMVINIQTDINLGALEEVHTHFS